MNETSWDNLPIIRKLSCAYLAHAQPLNKKENKNQIVVYL